MQGRTCTIKILDEVNCVFVGLHPDHVGYFYEEYAFFAPNYFFNPKFKLGTWDGKIRYFHKTGKTHVNLLEEMIPRVVGLGYKVKIVDNRQSQAVYPDHIDENFFSNVIEPDSGEPWKFRDYQIELVNALIDNGGGVGVAGTGAGKALSLDAKVLTPTGWRRNGELQPGDKVVTPKGTISTILDVFPQPKKQLYQITFHDGSTVKCCADHLWQVKHPKQLHKAWTEDKVVTTDDILQFLERKASGVHTPGNISIPLVDPIEYPSHREAIDPYVLGTLLGDGGLTQGGITFSTKDKQLLVELQQRIDQFDVQIKHQSKYDYRIVKRQKQNTFPPTPNQLTEELIRLGVMGKRSYEKSVPSTYKIGSIEQRFELLRGLFDTDGTADKRGNISFTTTSKQLANDVQEIVWSVGGICTITSRHPHYTYGGQHKVGRRAYTCFVRHPEPKQFFTLDRKKDRIRDQHADGRIELTRRVVSVIPVEEDYSQCIAIDDPDHLYITNNYIVTHNTSMTAALALSYEQAGNLRSIIIVPDKNLTDQTRDEYAFFGLDVGEYSGDRKDYKHMHVVSTWQALQNNPKVIQDFDVIIVDECHGLRGNVLTKLLNEYGKDIPYRFGVTGTIPKEDTDAMSVKVAVGLVQYTIPAHELIEQGHLAKLHIDIMQLEVDFKKQYDEFLEENKDNPELRKITYKKFKDTYFPDFPAEKRFLQSQAERLEWITAFLEAKAERGNVLCLVDGIRFGKKLQKAIPNSVFLYGKDKVKERKKVYELFKENDNLLVIATVNIASTGLNIKRIFNMIYIDVGKSFIRTIQTIGRGLRKAPDKDFVSVTDICSDLKYAKRHLNERIKFYKEAKYPHKKRLVDYS